MPSSDPLQVPHDTLFDVYLGPRGERKFAMGPRGDDIVLVELVDGSEATVSVCSTKAALAALASKLKAGYRRDGVKQFFNARGQRFSDVHPDVDWRGAQWVLAATPQDLQGAIDKVVAVVRTTSAATIDQVEIESWVTQQRRNAVHVVAFDDHVIWSLALAHCALAHGWALRVADGLPRTPDVPPATNPSLWADWLTTRFRASDIHAATAALGWTAAALINSDRPAMTQNNLAALL